MKNLNIRFKRRVKFESIQFILRFKSFKTSESIIIFSEPRGGSTWLMELLAKIPNTVINFEPLHVLRGVVPNRFKWGENVFIEEENENDEYLELMSDILRLKEYSWWTIGKNSTSEVFKGKKVITKFIQGNMLLPWITNKINLKYKPIYLLRHPISCSLSRLKIWDKGQPLAKYQPHKSLNNEGFFEHELYINSLDSKLQRNVALWCINNKYIIEHPRHNIDWIVMYYEDLVLQPLEQMEYLVKRNKMKFNFKDLAFAKIREPSKTTLGTELKSDPKVQIEKFLTEVDKEELIKIQKILDYFSIKNYTAFDAIPKR